MKTTKTLLTSLALLTITAMTGCQQLSGKPVKQSQPPKYPLPQLISMVQQNSQNLTCFRSTGGKLACNVPTSKGLRKYDLGGVAVLYQKPNNLYISGTYMGQPALQIGSNSDRYWLGILHDPSTLNWGYWKYSNSPCNEWQLGGPMKLLEAVGQVNLRDLEGRLIGPVLKRDPSANILMYMSVDTGDNWYIAKEITLSSTEPIVIDQIIYYNPDGTEYLFIRFFDYQNVGNAGSLATKIRLDWPANGSYMQLTHGQTSLAGDFPAEAFTMPDQSTYETVEQVDAKCME